MSTHTIKQQLLNLFRKSKKDRHRFLSNHLSASIAAQIFSLRTDEERNWTQAQLANEAGVAQPRIPVYESPDYGAYSLTTLKKLAYAFDGALIVKFVSFDELANEIAFQSSATVDVRKFEESPLPLCPKVYAQGKPTQETGLNDAMTEALRGSRASEGKGIFAVNRQAMQSPAPPLTLGKTRQDNLVSA